MHVAQIWRHLAQRNGIRYSCCRGGSYTSRNCTATVSVIVLLIFALTPTTAAATGGVVTTALLLPAPAAIAAAVLWLPRCIARPATRCPGAALSLSAPLVRRVLLLSVAVSSAGSDVVVLATFVLLLATAAAVFGGA